MGLKENLELSRMSVLVVDDSADTRRVIRHVLRSIGIVEICEVENGLDAQVVLRERFFDLVIADWMMPKLSGLELLEWMRSREDLTALPFIMVTALNSRESVVEALQGGTSDYITKPFNIKTLANKVRRALGLAEEATSSNSAIS